MLNRRQFSELRSSEDSRREVLASTVDGPHKRRLWGQRLALLSTVLVTVEKEYLFYLHTKWKSWTLKDSIFLQFRPLWR